MYVCTYFCIFAWKHTSVHSFHIVRSCILMRVSYRPELDSQPQSLNRRCSYLLYAYGFTRFSRMIKTQYVVSTHKRTQLVWLQGTQLLQTLMCPCDWCAHGIWSHCAVLPGESTGLWSSGLPCTVSHLHQHETKAVMLRQNVALYMSGCDCMCVLYTIAAMCG